MEGVSTYQAVHATRRTRHPRHPRAIRPAGRSRRGLRRDVASLYIGGGDATAIAIEIPR